MTTTDVLTKTEEKKLKALKKLADEMAMRTALYGSAIDGLAASADKDIASLEEYDLDGKMSHSEDELAQQAVDVVKNDIAEAEAFEVELTADDRQEEEAILEDEADPEVEGQRLADAGVTE